MTAVVPIRFKYNPKTYWFTYEGRKPQVNEYVIVERNHTDAYGWVESEPFEINEEQESSLNTELKSIVRIATDNDYEKIEQLRVRSHAAKQVFRELSQKHNLDIKPIDVEYSLNGDRATFHFSSEERVDFRGLIRDLASRLHVGVDMRQIGVRDEARLVGGLGHCGEMLCCVRMSGQFQPVSIKMAKQQDLPLNPTKVSGACGRLMCCLRYECDAYEDYKQRAPKVGTRIKTPLGEAKVVELNTPRELVRVKMLDEEYKEATFFVPLTAMEIDPESDSEKPTIIADQAFVTYAPATLTRDKVFEVPAEELLPEEPKQNNKRRKKKNNANKKAADPQAQKDEQHTNEHQGPKKKNRRRRRSGGSQQAQGKQQTNNSHPQQEQSGQHTKQRPGQNSSGIQNPQSTHGSQGAQPQQSGTQPAKKNNRKRRRSTNNGGGNGGQNQGNQHARSNGNNTSQQRAQGGSNNQNNSQNKSGQHRRKPRRTSGGPQNQQGQHQSRSQE